MLKMSLNLGETPMVYIEKKKSWNMSNFEKRCSFDEMKKY